MDAKALTIQIETKRIGKYLFIEHKGKLLARVDIQEEYHLTDEKTAEIVAWLDEHEDERGEQQ